MPGKKTAAKSAKAKKPAAPARKAPPSSTAKKAAPAAARTRPAASASAAPRAGKAHSATAAASSTSHGASRPAPKTAPPPADEAPIATYVQRNPPLVLPQVDNDDMDDAGLLSGPRNVSPYIAKRGEQYMNKEQLDHFRQETGLSLENWRQQACVFAALPRLIDGQRVTSVALDLGYDSPAAFTTMFRRMLGQTPRAFAGGRRQ